MKPLLLKMTLATLTIVAFAACIHRPSPNINGDENSIGNATAAIDAGNYESAVKNLNDYLTTYPNDARARLLLSNAYVRWAGVRFNDFIPLARYYLDQSEKKSSFDGGSDSLLKALRNSQKVSLGAVADAIDDFEKVLSESEAFSAAYNLIPELDETQYVHFSAGLNQAILAGSTKKGDILYRVVLRVVDLKFRWIHGDVFKFMDEQCKVVPPNLLKFFNTTRIDYQTISSELIIIHPNLSDELLGDIDKFIK